MADDLFTQAQNLPPEERVRLIQRLAESLVVRTTTTPSRKWAFGALRGPKMSTEEDFHLAEWNPSEEEMNGP